MGPKARDGVVIVFADLHLKESTAEICWKVLDAVERLALEDPDRRVVFCGDFWQLRYQVSVKLLNRVLEILDRWERQRLAVDLVPGNHDQVTVDGRNALEALQRGHVTVWTEPGVGIPFANGASAGFVPYRKDPAQQAAALQGVLEQLEKMEQRFPVVFGHFAVRGAKMNGGRKDQDGLIPQGRKDKTLLVLGHYHKFQWVNGSEAVHGPEAITAVYVGSPYQQSFGEVGNFTGVGCVSWDDHSGWAYAPWELQIGPKHYVVTWDLSKRDRPPAPESLVMGVPGPEDRVRVDIVGPSSRVTPALIDEITDAGYTDPQVTVQSVAEMREARFGVEPGESLLSAAERFVAERKPDNSEAVLDKLRQWALIPVGPVP